LANYNLNGAICSISSTADEEAPPLGHKWHSNTPAFVREVRTRFFKKLTILFSGIPGGKIITKNGPKKRFTQELALPSMPFSENVSQFSFTTMHQINKAEDILSAYHDYLFLLLIHQKRRKPKIFSLACSLRQLTLHRIVPKAFQKCSDLLPIPSTPLLFFLNCDG
jgi:hypothetical protein